MPVNVGSPDMSGATYHLWLKPHGAAYSVLARTIGTLAQKLDAPVFEPHVTLLGHLAGPEQEHVLRSATLARRLARFPIVLTQPCFGDEYFRSLYMLVHQSSPVMNANALARRAFQREDEPYMPHLSLVYGVCPEARRTEILSMLPANVRTSFEARALFLIRAGSTDTEDWQEIREFRITGSAFR